MLAMMPQTGSHQVGNFAEERVNGNYLTDTQKLWSELQSTAPAPRRPRRPTTPKRKEPNELSPPRRHQTPGERAFNIPLAAKAKPKKVSTPKEASKGAGGSEADPTSDAVEKVAKAKVDTSRPASAKKKVTGKAKTQRSASPSRVMHPEWNATGPPRRAPGEVANKYTLRGELGITGALTMRPEAVAHAEALMDGELAQGGSSALSVADSDITTATTQHLPNRITGSPSGKMHPNPDRRNELRDSDMFSNINYFATARVPNRTASSGDAVYTAPDNDRRMKESSWISSQAWFESLRYYPGREEAVKNEDCVATFSGNTHGSTVPSEHLENDVRNRVGLAPADPGWMPHQLQEQWAPEMDHRMKALSVSAPGGWTVKAFKEGAKEAAPADQANAK